MSLAFAGRIFAQFLEPRLQNPSWE